MDKISCPSHEQLSLFLDGVLGSREAAHIEEHLKDCADCASRISDFGALDGLLILSLPEASASGCPARIAASPEHFEHLSVCAACRRRLAQRRRLPLTQRWVPLAAAAVFMVSIGLALVLSQSGSDAALTSEEIRSHFPDLPASASLRVAVVTGGAGLRSAASERSHAALENEPVGPGDTLTTARGQSVKLALGGDAELVVNENSRLRIRGAGETGPQVRLEQGELLATSSRALEIETPAGTAALSMGEFHLIATPDQTDVSVLEGLAAFRGADPVVSIESGHEIHVKGKSAGKPHRFDRRPDLAWADSLKRMFFQEQFRGGELSAHWRVPEWAKGTLQMSRETGRDTLSMVVPSRHRHSRSLIRTVGDFPVAGPVAFEIEYRIPHALRGGRLELLLHPLSRKGTPGGNLRWSLSGDQETLDVGSDAHRESTALWSTPRPAADAQWHRIRLVLSPQDVTLFRDGNKVVERAHGLAGVDRVGLLLGGMPDRKGKEAFECQFGRVTVERATLE
jgi:hypothetical protein